jgi:hypothetical protein
MIQKIANFSAKDLFLSQFLYINRRILSRNVKYIFFDNALAAGSCGIVSACGAVCREIESRRDVVWWFIFKKIWTINVCINTFKNRSIDPRSQRVPAMV